MPLSTRSGRNQLLKEFRSAIESRTFGRLSHLSLDVVDGALLVKARSETYHTVQLALAAIHEFVADFPRLTPAKMLFRVQGHLLALDAASGCPKADPPRRPRPRIALQIENPPNCVMPVEVHA